MAVRELRLVAFVATRTLWFAGFFAALASVVLVVALIAQGAAALSERSLARFVQLVTFGISVGGPIACLQARRLHGYPTMSRETITCVVLSGIIATFGGILSVLVARAHVVGFDATLTAHLVDAARFAPAGVAACILPLLPLPASGPRK